MGLKGVVCPTGSASAISCSGHSGVSGVVVSCVFVVVAMISIPVLSRPMKTSRPSVCKAGTLALPMGALPGGTILRNVGVAGSPVIDKLAGELSQVLRTSMFEVELPPAMKTNAPLEENAIASAGAVNGYACSA